MSMSAMAPRVAHLPVHQMIMVGSIQKQNSGSLPHFHIEMCCSDKIVGVLFLLRPFLPLQLEQRFRTML